jgi:hypothetical protein
MRSFKLTRRVGMNRVVIIAKARKIRKLAFDVAGQRRVVARRHDRHRVDAGKARGNRSTDGFKRRTN